MPKRRKPAESSPLLRPTSGFEGLIPVDSSEDFFFASWLANPEEAAEILEHGEGRAPLSSDPRFGVTVSAAGHFLLLVSLLIEPGLEMLGIRRGEEEPPPPRENPLVVFMEEPAPPEIPPLVAVPLVPVPREPAAPEASKPPLVADDRLLIPKAMLAPPEDRLRRFMNDLPFSEGNTEEFFTDEEVKEPGEEGETTKPAEEELALVPEPGEDDSLSDEAEGLENGNDGAEVAEKKIDPRALGDLLFGEPRSRAESRPRIDIKPPEPKPTPSKQGVGGENGAFTDIRRFLAEARFENPDGGLVTDRKRSLYYNDKGANFVPWITRMLAEVKRNWLSPDWARWDYGHVAIGITVARDGTMVDLKMLVPSGKPGFDNAAIGALRASVFLPLPADYPDDRFDIILVFWYNERPYDIFG